MRFGLVGTGHWARVTQAAALQAARGVDLVGVWGRRPEAAQALAQDVGARAYDDVDAMIADVDAVAFSVPPYVQSEIALRAARAGRHLLLEKPVALDPDEAARISDAVSEAGVASVVFFTARFQPEHREWLRSLESTGGWRGGWSVWLATAFAPDSPFDTPWRREHGALWDVGPHALAAFTGALGPVARVRAAAGAEDLVHLVLHHESGATSTASLTLRAPVPAAGTELHVWGEQGRSTMPGRLTSADEALGVAVAELVEQAGSSLPAHPCDVHFGRHVVELLADAQRQLDPR